MSSIAPTKKNIAHPGKTKKYSSPLRLWHWLNMLLISGSLLTVLLNATILKGRNDAPVIKSALQKAGAAITDAQVKAATHDLSDKVWDVHIYFGYGLATLLLFRIILEFFQLADQKFIRILKTAQHNYLSVKKRREASRHELVVKIIYSIFYSLLIVMVITGLFLAFEDFFEPYRAIRGTVKDIHNFGMYLVLAFITIHLAGVFLAERKDDKGIVSDMINGGSSNQ